MGWIQPPSSVPFPLIPPTASAPHGFCPPSPRTPPPRLFGDQRGQPPPLFSCGEPGRYFEEGWLECPQKQASTCIQWMESYKKIFECQWIQKWTNSKYERQTGSRETRAGENRVKINRNRKQTTHPITTQSISGLTQTSTVSCFQTCKLHCHNFNNLVLKKESLPLRL